MASSSSLFDLPRSLTLPSGLRVTLRRHDMETKDDEESDDARPLFAQTFALFDSGAVTIEHAKKIADIRDLPLADFHVVRGVLMKAKLLDEHEVEFECHNCEELIIVERPCEGLETGPWEDGEANDPELDRLAAVDVPIDLVRKIALSSVARVRHASTITFRARTVREAMPLFQAFSQDPLTIDHRVVKAMGIAALGSLEDPKRIAVILSGCEDVEFDAVADAFLAVHYPLRLARDVFCTKCKARNTIDAPHEREVERGMHFESNIDDANTDKHDFSAVPTLDDFVELVHEIAEPLLHDIPGERVEVIVEDGTPAVDDGGEPLLGSYVPPPPKDAPVPMQPPTVTIYYRTFEAIEREEGRFDWEDELRETIEHELEHHIYFLRGDDPMDEEEHAEIDREAVRVVGRGETRRRTLAIFGSSIPDFVRRAWPLIAIAAVVLVITLAEGRCQ